MTKQDYFEQLLDSLPEISPEEQQQIYDYYDELICDGIEAGKTEEEMLRQFGAPDTLAVRMQEEWELSSLPAPTEGIIPATNFSSDSAHLSCDGTDCCYTSENQINFLDFFIQEYNFSATPSSDEVLRIYFPKELQNTVEITENNEKLYFSCRPKKQNPFSFFRRSLKNGTIRLEIPLKKAQILHVSARNGSISTQNLALNETVLQTTNAAIKVTALVTENLKLITKNAAIHLEDAIYADAILKTSNASIHLTDANGGSLQCETSNSKIQSSKVTASNLILTTSNGGIAVEDCTAASVSLRTSNAKIKTEALKSNDISFTTSNASIRGSICGNEEEYSITCRTTNGNCEPQTHIRPNMPGKLSAHSSNGNIQISFFN